MRIYSPLFLLGALGVLSAAGSAAAADTANWKCETCPYPKGVSASVEVGVGAVSGASSKFGDLTGLQRDEGHLVLGGSVSRRGEDGYFADVTATDLGLDTRQVTAQTGREGLYTLKLGYSEVPRHLTDGAATPFLGVGGSVLTLPAGFPSGSTATMPLAASLQQVGVGYKRSRFDLSATWLAGENWTHHLTLRHDVRDGTRVQGAAFFANTSQLVIPVDQTTDQIELGTAYAGRRWQASLAYQISLFRNGQDSLTWDNPFFPVIAGSAQGQLALAPDNEMHQIVGTGAYQISPKIRASADFSVGRMTQNSSYLAPTLNAALAATVPALPAASLDGRVDTFNGSVRLSAAPTDKLRLNASYARDVRDNRTSVLTYPMVSNDMFLDAATRTNTPYTIKQDRLKLNADYRGPGSLKLSAGIEEDDRERSYQEVVNTREATVWGRLRMQARENLNLSLKLAHAERRHSTYGISTWYGYPENPLLRKYYLAARNRDSVGLRAETTIGEKVNLALSADYADDHYGESAVGLTGARSANFGADLSFAMSEQTQLHLYGQTEEIRSRQAGSQAFSVADWTAHSKDRFDMLGLGVQHAAIANKLDLGADLTFSRSNSDVSVDNGTNPPAFPTATTALDSLKFYATYKLKDNLSLTGSYWYERYEAKDWRLDSVQPNTVFNLLALGQQAPRYTANVVRVALRYRF
jgi:MtrB/PioB family decaheme-associated outer membrane protein